MVTEALSAACTLGPRHRTKYFLWKSIALPTSWRYFWLQNGKGRNAELQTQELTSESRAVYGASKQCSLAGARSPCPQGAVLVGCGRRGFPGSFGSSFGSSHPCAIGRNGRNRHPLLVSDCSGAAAFPGGHQSISRPTLPARSLHSSVRRQDSLLSSRSGLAWDLLTTKSMRQCYACSPELGHKRQHSFHLEVGVLTPCEQ